MLCFSRRVSSSFDVEVSLTDFAVEASKAENVSSAADGVAEETVRADIDLSALL